MSMHLSVVSIEGDRLGEIAEVLRECEYVIEESFVVASGERASRELHWNPDRNHVAKVAYVADGWTFIVDPEMVLMSDDIWLTCSLTWNTRVVGWVCEGASGSYGLTVYRSGRKIREVMRSDGETIIDEGEPLPEETGVDWDQAWEDEILAIAERCGAAFNFFTDREYTVFRLDESQMTMPEGPNPFAG